MNHSNAILAGNKSCCNLHLNFYRYPGLVIVRLFCRGSQLIRHYHAIRRLIRLLIPLSILMPTPLLIRLRLSFSRERINSVALRISASSILFHSTLFTLNILKISLNIYKAFFSLSGSTDFGLDLLRHCATHIGPGASLHFAFAVSFFKVRQLKGNIKVS